MHVEFVYKPLVSKYIKTIQNENKSYKYNYQYINAILYTTKAASTFLGFMKMHLRSSFYDPYSSIIPYLFKNSSPHSKQYLPIKQKLTTYVVKSPIEKYRIN